MVEKRKKIAVIGLGYVGLPLAVAFAEKYAVTGFDISADRILQLQKGEDNTGEVRCSALKKVLVDTPANKGLLCTDYAGLLAASTVFIVTVPTPVDKYNNPDLVPLYKASATVGYYLKKGDIVIYESTVYPGATEEVCVPLLEKGSGLIYNKDFFAGYSPERINPGDKVHTVTRIRKITSGSTPQTARIVNRLYRSVITAGTFMASSIKVAEAAKVIENSQRDINIAFINELSHIFHLLEIDTREVLEAAATKWNFLPFQPGLVGGHCIGVDPYYLAQKAIEVGYHPEVILSGRKINDGMGKYVATEVVKKMIIKGLEVKDAPVLVMGITFKENCPDVRNTRVVDIIHTLESYRVQVTVWDPLALPAKVEEEYGIVSTIKPPAGQRFSAIIIAVAHDVFREVDLASLKRPEGAVVYDVKGILPRTMSDVRL